MLLGLLESMPDILLVLDCEKEGGRIDLKIREKIRHFLFFSKFLCHQDPTAWSLPHALPSYPPRTAPSTTLSGTAEHLGETSLYAALLAISTSGSVMSHIDIFLIW